MRTRPIDSAYMGAARAARPHAPGRVSGVNGRSAASRMPSTAGYMVAACLTATALFLVLWWMLEASGDESPWIPAALAACVVMLVAAAAREVVMRRAWTRHLLEQEQTSFTGSGEHRRHRHTAKPARTSGDGRRSGGSVAEAHASQLRAIQRQSAEADSLPSATPETHMDVYHLCKDYLAGTEETLRSVVLSPESRGKIRTSRERVRALQKHHLLSWARGASQSLAHEAQQRVMYGDKIETARRALDCLDSALKLYPDEDDLRQSASALREYIVSVKVGRWIEMAERAAFKSKYRRAIDRYRDALFYLSREELDEGVRGEMAERIGREIEMLRARLVTEKKVQHSNGAEDDWSTPGPKPGE